MPGLGVECLMLRNFRNGQMPVARSSRRAVPVRKAAAWAILVCASALATSAKAEQTLDGATLSRLKAGEAIVDVRPDPDGATGLISAIIDIAAPPARVWAVMLDCEHSMRAVAALKSCRIIEQGADGRYDIREHVVQWLWPLPEVRSVFRSDYQPVERIRFQRIGGDLALLEGEWRLAPMRGGQATRLFYRARITPGWPVPDSMARAAIESDVPNTLKALRTEATGHE